MALFTSSWLYDSITITILITSIFVYWINSKLLYWNKRGIQHPPTTFLLGNMGDVMKTRNTGGFAEYTKALYNELKSKKQRHGGFYLICRPIYFPVDPEIIKNILQNDFNHFVDRGIYFNEKSDPLSAHLFSIEGAKWKNLRAKLTPTFTSGKMKMMFHTLIDCSKQLKIEMDKTAGKEPIEIKDILARFTTDIIGTCAFGIECNSLKDPNTEFRTHGNKFFKRNTFEAIKDMFTFIAPEAMALFGVTLIRKEFSDFFLNVIKQTANYRESNNIHRKDFMHLMLQLKNRGKLEDDGSVLKGDADEIETTITFNELAAQALVFFIAGFETSSTTMTFCLYELASNPEMQEKVGKEINQVLAKHNGEITYEAILEMSYMDKVVNETLRKYPPLPSLNRICTEDYKIPGSDLVLEKGTKLNIPVIGLHYDEEFYPNPLVFDPERFSEENKKTRPPITFLPFGEGPRICIGARFGMMQTKVGLTVLLKNYKFSVSSKTILPLKMDPESFILTTKGGMWLDYTKI